VNSEIVDSTFFDDAIMRYKSVNSKNDFDISKAELFLYSIENLGIADKDMRITLQENAVKVRLNYNCMDYVLDYNFEEPENVFILTRKDGKLIVKDCNLTNIPETLGNF